MSVVLYSTHCPRCVVLEKKLKGKAIDYIEINDEGEMRRKGYLDLPVLEVDNVAMQNGLVALVGVLISVLTLFDILFEKIKKKKYSDKKTDWFFNNKDTDRKMDDRADKNQYKFY